MTAFIGNDVMIKKKRRPIIAAMLSIIVPGLGQIYNGQIMKAFIFFFLSILPLFFALAGFQFYFHGLIFLISFTILLYFFIAGEAFFTAARLKEILVLPFDKWYYYFFVILIFIGFYYLTHDYTKSNVFAINAYKISTETMSPSLKIGDRIIANLKYYKKNNPRRGDVVIYKRPENKSDSIGRIIAIENDVIESRRKIIYVNGKVLNEPYIQHNDKLIIEDQRDSFSPLTVRKGSVFVMGDNRDLSFDSRFFGSIDKTQLKGRVAYIYWSTK